MLEVTTYEADAPPIHAPNFFGSSRIVLPKLPEFIIDGKLSKATEVFLSKYKKELSQSPASVSKHHWWSGGLRDHIEQVINIAVQHAAFTARGLFSGLIGSMKFGESEDRLLDRVIVAALLHDAEKIFRYRYNRPDPNKPPRYSIMNKGGKLYKVQSHWEYAPGYRSASERHIAADLESFQIAADCGFPMEDWLMNAIIFAAGGYSPFAKEMQPTFEGVILHVADYTSANVFFNRGQGILEA